MEIARAIGAEPLNDTFDGDGAKRKETSKGKATQAETDTTRTLKSSRSLKEDVESETIRP